MKRIQKGAVIRNARDEIRKRFDSGEIWQDSVSLNQSLEIYDYDFLDKLFENWNHSGYKKAQKRREINTIVANLFFNRRRKSIAVSLERKSYKKSRYNWLSTSVINLISHLDDQNLIELKKGYRYPNGDARRTRIIASKKLLKLYPWREIQYKINPVELVIKHDRKTKKEIDYKDTKETKRIRKQLQVANQVNQSKPVIFDGSGIPVVLISVFSGRFTWYGRLHTTGRNQPQGLSKNERGRIKIDGEEVIELDYSGLHPNILYANEKIQFQGDPYSIVDNRPEVRPFLKIILLAMINAKDYVQAERVGNDWFRTNYQAGQKLKALGIDKAGVILNKFHEKHNPISHYFCSGKSTGLSLMNKDSKIALDVVHHFTKRKIPIIPVHDSFIVQKKYRNQLKQVMHETYSKHTGYHITVK